MTCNELYGLNSYIVNRPGRFHYHFRFDYPTPDAIREYLRDKLRKDSYGEIEKVVDFSRKVNLNYDCLLSIAFELNSGSSFASAIIDLNIMTTDLEEFSVHLIFEDGTRLFQFRHKTNLFSIDETQPEVDFYDTAGNYILSAYYDKRRIVYDRSIQATVVPAEGFRIEYAFISNEDEDNRANLIRKLKSSKPLYMTFEKKPMQNLHYIV